MATIQNQANLLRISWSAVFAGVVISLVMGLILLMLGAGIGASELAPLEYQNPLHGFAFASGVWLAILTVVATLAGAYLAGRCAPRFGWLHGMLSWSLVTLFCVYFAATLTGSIATAVGNTAVAGAVVASQDSDGTGSTMTAIVNAANQQMQRYGVYIGELQTPTDQQIRENADAAARKVARATWWGFALLLIGAVVGAAAGNLGFRHQTLLDDPDQDLVVTARSAPPVGRADPLF